jgi:hypothetical protein
MGSESDPITRLLADIEEEHHALTALMARLPLDWLAERRNGQWSAIDLLVHITAWQANALTIAHRLAAPGAPALVDDPMPSQALGLDTHQFNADLLESHRDWTIDQALAWHNQVFADLLRALATLPPNRLLGGGGPHGAQRWFARPALTHSREHRLDFEQRARLT